MTTDQMLRAFLTGEVAIAITLTGALVGTLWPKHQREWHWRAIGLSALAVLVYVFTGQIKAFLIDIPFDGFSWVGLIALLLANGALIWSLHHEEKKAKAYGAPTPRPRKGR